MLLRAFVPRRVRQDTLEQLTDSLGDEIVSMGISGVTSAPIKQDNIVDAIIIDVTYDRFKNTTQSHMRLLTEQISNVMRKSPKMHGTGLGFLRYWEGVVYTPRALQNYIRFITVLQSNGMDLIEKLYNDIKVDVVKGSFNYGKFPNPDSDYQIDARMALFEANEEDHQRIVDGISQISDRFAYSQEERVFSCP